MARLRSSRNRCLEAVNRDAAGVVSILVHVGLVDASWQRRIRRAGQFAADSGAAAPLLAFYTRLLRSQNTIYDSLNVRRPSGDLDGDIAVLAEGGSALLREVAESGPDLLAADARALLEVDDSTIASLLLAYWRASSV